MKKYLLLCIVLLLFVFSPKVLAASGNLSVSSNSIYVGDSFTISVNISASAAWNIHVISSGPVSGCAINQADATADALDTNKVFTANCTATGTGTISINLSGDVTSAVDGNAVVLSDTKSVTVSTKPTPPVENNTNTIPNDNVNNTPQNILKALSDDSSLRTLSVEGFDIEFAPTTYMYDIDVENNVEKVSISAQANNKASTKINNIDTLIVGKNVITIIVTAENGKESIYTLNINRKDDFPEFTLSDIKEKISTTTKDTIILKLDKDTIIPIDIINIVKSSNRTLIINSNNNKYSWTLNFNNYNDNTSFNSLVNFDPKDYNLMQKMANNAKIFPFEIVQTNIPTNSSLKLSIGSQYVDGSNLSLYEYSENKITLINNEVIVNNGYVELNIAKASNYFLTQDDLTKKVIKDKESTKAFKITIIIESIVIIGLICLIAYTLIVKKINQEK